MSFHDLQGLIEYINQFGMFAPAVAFVLFMVQAIFPVFPYIILAAAGGMLFGFKAGVLLAWLGALTGACLAYWMCRLLDFSAFLEKLYHRTGYDMAELNEKTAFWTIILARIIPVVPTPLINAGAAMRGVSFTNFLVSSAIGKIPSAVLYTGVGLAIFKADNIKTILLIIGLTIMLICFLQYQARHSHFHKFKRAEQKSRD